jgi:hypothetical protein
MRPELIYCPHQVIEHAVVMERRGERYGAINVITVAIGFDQMRDGLGRSTGDLINDGFAWLRR